MRDLQSDPLHGLEEMKHLTYCLIPVILSVCHRANQLPPLVLRDSRRIVLEDRHTAAGKQNDVIGGAPTLAAWQRVDPEEQVHALV